MVLTDIYVPSLDWKYDFWLDETCYASVAADEIRSMIQQKEQVTTLWENEKAVLFDADTQAMLQGNMTLEECGIKDGCHLILV